jgi:hypothetical protein
MTWLALIPGEVWTTLGTLLAGLLAFWGIKRSGRKEAEADQLKKDIDRAEIIKKRAQKARADADRENDAARILRKHGRLRD